MSKKKVFWADQLAQRWIARRGNRQLVEIGVSPSGPIHIGHLRETMAGELASRVLKDAGAEVRFVFFADSMDPLRNLKQFPDESHPEYIGRPLCDIPSPDGKASDYAEAFLAPYFRSLDKLGVHLEVIRSEVKYRAGAFTEQISKALEATEKIAAIIAEESGRELPEGWMPINPICAGCGRLTTTQPLEYDTGKTLVSYRCECGHQGEADYSRGEAKLPWRVDWPARWDALGVTVEPFGKDHGSPGGSYATGRRICKEVFGSDPIEPVQYEWINLKGQGAMSSSKGIAVTIDTMLEAIPPEVLRYLILRNRPNQAIDFDPRDKMIQIVDEFESLEQRILDGQEQVSEANLRTYHLARIDPQEPREPIRIPFRQLCTLVQVAAGERENLKAILKRTGYEADLEHWERVEQLADYATRWLDRFAPEQEKMWLARELPQEVSGLSEAQRAFLGKLAEYFAEEHSPEEIHQQVYTIAEEKGVATKEAFVAIYIALLGKQRGPRAGFFLASLEPEFIRERFKEAAGGR